MKAAWVVIGVALVLASGCAKQDWIDRTLVTVDVTGVWIGSAGEGKLTFPVQFDLEQAGSKVKGAARLQGSGAGRAGPDVSGSIEGTVAGDVLHFTGSRGNWAGTLTVSGDKMEGPGTAGAIPGQLTLRRVDPSSPLGSPPR